MSTIANLLTLARIYGTAERIELKTVSSRACKDSKKLRALSLGATITVSRADTVIRWFSDHWPEGAIWPADVPRPETTRSAA